MKRKLLHEKHPYGSDLTRVPLSQERSMVLDRLGPPGRLLEVGASSGHFTAVLQRTGWDVTAVEIDPSAASLLKANVVIVGDIEDPLILDQTEGPFDVILLMHVLEHLVDPWSTLRNLRRLLAPGGHVLILLPNVAAWRIRKDLFLNGSFTYEDVGILDRTHLRFFTLDSARELIARAGFDEIDWAIAEACVPLERRLSRLPGGAALSRAWHRWLVSRNPNLCAEILLFDTRPRP